MPARSCGRSGTLKDTPLLSAGLACACTVRRAIFENERDGAPDAIAFTKESFPTLAHLIADGGYAGEKLETALQDMDGPTIEIVKRPDGAKGFVVIARRWVVERTFAWLGRCRRLAKDWEATIASSEAWLLIASIRRTTRLIART